MSDDFLPEPVFINDQNAIRQRLLAGVQQVSVDRLYVISDFDQYSFIS